MAEQAANPEWKATFEDLTDIVTVGAVSQAKLSSVLGAGYLEKFRGRSVLFRNCVWAGLLAFSLLILAAYSYVSYKDNESKLGLITSVSVTLMDLFNFLLFQTGLIETPMGIIFMLILNRVLMVVFGEGFWIYGYMVLYVLYAVVFYWLIAKARFPFEGDVVLK